MTFDLPEISKLGAACQTGSAVAATLNNMRRSTRASDSVSLTDIPIRIDAASRVRKGSLLALRAALVNCLQSPRCGSSLSVTDQPVRSDFGWRGLHPQLTVSAALLSFWF